MARLALSPQVAGVVDVAPEYRMEEIEVTEGCEAAGKAIADVSGSAVVVALRRSDGRVHPQPPADSLLRPGDVVIAMGTTGALTRLEELFTPPRPARLGPVGDDAADPRD
jgi:Trk K+ transport system NAD-binding subunit